MKRKRRIKRKENRRGRGRLDGKERARGFQAACGFRQKVTITDTHYRKKEHGEEESELRVCNLQGNQVEQKGSEGPLSNGADPVIHSFTHTCQPYVLCTSPGHTSGQNSQKSALMESKCLAGKSFLYPTLFACELPSSVPKEGEIYSLYTCVLSTSQMASVAGCWGYGMDPCLQRAPSPLWRARYALRYLQFTVLEECTW